MNLLHATYNFPPEFSGGSEVYVEALAQEQVNRGQHVEILCGTARPVDGAERFSIQSEMRGDVRVWRFSIDGSRITMPELYTTHAAGLEAFWKNWLDRRRPDLLHLHGHSLTVSGSLMRVAQGLGIPMVFTLHNAILLCAHGDLIDWRGRVCDGRATLLRCLHCTSAARLGTAGGALMTALTPLLSHLPLPESSGWSKARSALHYPGLMRARMAAQQEMLATVSRWHVFSEWSRRALELNGVPAEKILLLRHPVPEATTARPRIARGNELRLGYFGRFNPIKGLPVLLEAIRRVPDAPLRLEIYGSAQDASASGESRGGVRLDGAGVARLAEAAVRDDARVLLRGWIPHSEQALALTSLDAVVVPSQCVETGPLTVLEAFAAGVPVVGSDLSGINEWVVEGRNGWLVPAGDAAALAARLERLAHNPALLDTARQFPSLDSMTDQAGKLMDAYRSLLPASSRRSSPPDSPAPSRRSSPPDSPAPSRRSPPPDSPASSRRSPPSDAPAPSRRSPPSDAPEASLKEYPA